MEPTLSSRKEPTCVQGCDFPALQNGGLHRERPGQTLLRMPAFGQHLNFLTVALWAKMGKYGGGGGEVGGRANTAGVHPGVWRPEDVGLDPSSPFLLWKLSKVLNPRAWVSLYLPEDNSFPVGFL